MSAPTIAPEVAAILVTAARLGIVLQAAGEKLRYRPRSAMTPELAQRIKATKPALLDLLRGDGATPPTDTTPPPSVPIGPEKDKSSVASVLKQARAGNHALWSGAELALLARTGITPADRPLVDAIKDTFADTGEATVLEVRRDPAWPRREAARLIRSARKAGDRDRAVAMRDAWRERLAICTIDGNMTIGDAEQIALEELGAMLY